MRTRSGFVKVNETSKAPARTSYASGICYPLKTSQLPAELYREIFQYLSERELVPLLATSRDVRFESMRLYFCHIVMEDDERNLIERFSKFRAYLGPLVKTLVIREIGPKNPHVHAILSSVPNLVSLTLSWQPVYFVTARARFFPHKPPFRLQVLVLATYMRRRALVDFVKTQRSSLVRLHASIYRGNLSCTFPQLRILGSPVELLASLSQTSTKIRCFELGFYGPREMAAARFIRALRIRSPATALDHLSAMFPNVQFMVIHDDGGFHTRSANEVPEFQSLQKLVFCAPSLYGRIAEDAVNEVASSWFERNPKLERLEVFFQDEGWIVRPGEIGAEQQSVDCLDDEEWLRRVLVYPLTITHPLSLTEEIMEERIFFTPLLSSAKKRRLRSFSLSFRHSTPFKLGRSARAQRIVGNREFNMHIREVWATNLDQEMRAIRNLIDLYPYVAMDTEFPGVVARPIGSFKTSSDYHYQTMRCNVDLLKLIRIGLTLSDDQGNYPPEPDACTWQFNFRFSAGEDMYAPDSLDILQKSGIDFARHEEIGISPGDFAELLITSGLVLSDETKWISFHSGYDFGFLLHILTAQSLPTQETDFFDILNMWFPAVFDVKYIMRQCKMLKGGLQELADDLGLPRTTAQNQAGSDSLLTAASFFRLKEVYFSEGASGGSWSDSTFSGHLYGLGSTYINGIIDASRPGGITSAERERPTLSMNHTGGSANVGAGVGHGQVGVGAHSAVGHHQNSVNVGHPHSNVGVGQVGGHHPNVNVGVGGQHGVGVGQHHPGPNGVGGVHGMGPMGMLVNGAMSVNGMGVNGMGGQMMNGMGGQIGAMGVGAMGGMGGQGQPGTMGGMGGQGGVIMFPAGMQGAYGGMYGR